MAAYTANDPVHPEDCFQIGSIRKQFVAAAIMLLVEAGKMSRDEKASAFLGRLPDSWKAITVRQLLSHSAGSNTDRVAMIS